MLVLRESELNRCVLMPGPLRSELLEKENIVVVLPCVGVGGDILDSLRMRVRSIDAVTYQPTSR